MQSEKDIIALRFDRQNEARRLADNRWAVKRCLRIAAHDADRIEIHRMGESAHFRKLQTCGSIWHCAVCASKISERRALELDEVVRRWKDEHGAVFLATYTLSHNIGMSLEHVLNQLRRAYELMKSGRRWKEIATAAGYRYAIRTYEITYGKNGWHPHIHELIFTDPMSHGEYWRFQGNLNDKWIKSVLSAGGQALDGIAFDMRETDDDVAAYVAKFGKQPERAGWTVGREIAKATSKNAVKGGFTPQALLDASAQGDTRAGHLWREYATQVMGNRQTMWSKGLREAVGMKKEKSDKEICNETVDDVTLFAVISRAGWGDIMYLKKDQRARIIKIAKSGDYQLLRDFLLSLGLLPADISAPD